MAKQQAMPCHFCKDPAAEPAMAAPGCGSKQHAVWVQQVLCQCRRTGSPLLACVHLQSVRAGPAAYVFCCPRLIQPSMPCSLPPSRFSPSHSEPRSLPRDVGPASTAPCPPASCACFIASADGAPGFALRSTAARRSGCSKHELRTQLHRSGGRRTNQKVQGGRGRQTWCMRGEGAMRQQ